MIIKLPIKKLREDVKIPSFKTEGSVGFDLSAYIRSDQEETYNEMTHTGEPCIHLNPQDVFLVRTGFAIAVPQGYELQIRSRSGLSLKNGVIVLNSPATIDTDYRGELMIILKNTGKEDFIIRDGDRVAQSVLAVAPKVEILQVDILDDTVRGSDGLGSTGI